MGGREKRREIRSGAESLDSEVWARLYRQHYSRVRARLAAKVANEHDAQDLAQQVFIELARAKVPEEPLPYLRAIARNVLAQHRRRKLREEAALAGYLGYQQFTAEDRKEQQVKEDPPPGDLGEDVTEILTALLRRLSPGDAELVTLRCTEGLSVKDVAGRMHCSENALRKRIRKLRPLVRRLLRE